VTDVGKPLPLVMEAPRRGKPPRHLADLTADERKAAAEELGQPAFRVKQVAHHYFVKHERDPQAMTDLPAANRDAIA
jgi:23S rRNA (adenine2503-C2)-methyltransferase